MDRVFDSRALDAFYAEISSCAGISISELQDRLVSYSSLPMLPDDRRERTLSRRPWKKLRDEIAVLSDFFHFREIRDGRARFPLNDHPPDAVYWPVDASTSINIEVTIAQGRARYEMAKELISRGSGRGFVDLQDDAPQSEFDDEFSQSRRMHSTEQALDTVGEAIKICLSKKNRPEFKEFVLIVRAGLSALPHERWSAIFDDLRDAAATTPFGEVWIVGDDDQRRKGFQIK